MSLNVKNIFAPQDIQYSAAVDPGTNAIASFVVFNELEHLSGFSPWITETYSQFTDEQRENNKLIFNGMMDIFEFDKNWRSFAELMARLEELEPDWMADRILQGCVKIRHGAYAAEDLDLPMPSVDELRADEDLYIKHMDRLYAEKKERSKRQFHQKIHRLLRKPKELKSLVISHMTEIWDEYLSIEWKRRMADVKEAVSAFRNLDLSDASPQEAIRTVLGRDLMKTLDDTFEDLDQMIFVPSPHIGPYALLLKTERVAKLVFGAQHADRFQGNSASLSRSELLTRLGALSDPTRLQILEMLMERDEMRSAEVMTELGLSQSSASRHLIQLCACNLLKEKRVANSKFYSINRDRIDDTLDLLASYFQK